MKLDDSDIFLTDAEFKIVKEILKKHIPKIIVMIFGSRLTGENLKKFSDLDLAICGKISLDTFLKLKQAFSDSDLPFRVDLVEIEKVDDAFQEIIFMHHEYIQ